MNDYQKEQWDALSKAREAMRCLKPAEIDALHVKIGSYLEFRRQMDLFLRDHFERHCSQSCFEDHLSACCTKDGIVTFWADVIINALLSSQEQLGALAIALTKPAYPQRCTYLGLDGCQWRLRPLMCALFLCDGAKASVFSDDPAALCGWKVLQAQADEFRWPDKPVLFDWMESYFMDMGIHSSLMYINKSPGLLRVKRKAGLL